MTLMNGKILYGYMSDLMETDKILLEDSSFRIFDYFENGYIMLMNVWDCDAFSSILQEMLDRGYSHIFVEYLDFAYWNEYDAVIIYHSEDIERYNTDESL